MIEELVSDITHSFALFIFSRCSLHINNVDIGKGDRENLVLRRFVPRFQMETKKSINPQWESNLPTVAFTGRHCTLH